MLFQNKKSDVYTDGNGPHSHQKLVGFMLVIGYLHACVCRMYETIFFTEKIKDGYTTEKS